MPVRAVSLYTVLSEPQNRLLIMFIIATRKQQALGGVQDLLHCAGEGKNTIHNTRGEGKYNNTIHGEREKIVLMLKNSISTNVYYCRKALALYSLQDSTQTVSEKHSVPFVHHRGVKK